MAPCVYDPLLLEWAQKIILAGGAVFAAIFAWKRYRVADSVLRHDQFRRAARLLADRESSSRNLYLGRTASAAMLSFLATKEPDEYHVVVMRLFEAYLRFPVVYSGSEGKENVVAPDSSETAEIIRFIEQRSLAQKRAEKKVGYHFDLNPPSPFEFKEGKIYLNQSSLERVRNWCEQANIESQFLKDRHPQK